MLRGGGEDIHPSILPNATLKYWAKSKKISLNGFLLECCMEPRKKHAGMWRHERASQLGSMQIHLGYQLSYLVEFELNIIGFGFSKGCKALNLLPFGTSYVSRVSACIKFQFMLQC